MTAKHKLNSAYLNGALLFAGISGAITGSWAVFFVALIAVLVASIAAGAIRR